MQAEEINQKVQDIFRDVFLDEALAISDEMTADDVDRWDSITHYDMIALVEDRFGITLTTREVARLQCVGDLTAVIGAKVNA